jgi:hypothetical protein
MEMPPENIIDVAELMRRRNLKPTQEPAVFNADISAANG